MVYPDPVTLYPGILLLMKFPFIVWKRVATKDVHICIQIDMNAQHPPALSDWMLRPYSGARYRWTSGVCEWISNRGSAGTVSSERLQASNSLRLDPQWRLALGSTEASKFNEAIQLHYLLTSIRSLPLFSVLARTPRLLRRQHEFRGHKWREEMRASTGGLL